MPASLHCRINFMGRVTLLVGSKNIRKAEEMRRLLADLPLRVISLNDLPEELPSARESCDDFIKNAEAKALHYARLTGLLTVADDSGLCVDALGGAPGVRSSRYAGPEQDDRKNIQKLLRQLQGINDRNAHFVCAIALSTPDRVLFSLISSCYGRIATHPVGSSGFGYDPVFIPKNHSRTFAQMRPEEKDRISHRGRALREFRKQLLRVLPRITRA